MADELTGFLYAASKDISALETLRRDFVSEHAEAIAFHAQQAAEKMLKSIFLEKGVPARYEFSPEIGEGEALQAIAYCNDIAGLLERNGFSAVRADSEVHFLHDETSAESDS